MITTASEAVRCQRRRTTRVVGDMPEAAKYRASVFTVITAYFIPHLMRRAREASTSWRRIEAIMSDIITIAVRI